MRRFIYTLFAVVLVLSLTLLPASPASAVMYYLREHYTTGQDASTPLFPTDMWCAQSFTAELNHSVGLVELKLSRAGFPGEVTVSIRPTDEKGHPTDVVLASRTTDGNTLTTDNTTGVWRDIYLDAACNVTFGTKYAIVWSADNVTDINNCLYSHEDASDPTYAGGCMLISDNSGANWTDTDSDAMFRLWGETYVPEVWVDYTWLGSTPHDTVDGHTFGTDAFPTIQDGVNVVAEGGKVNVAAGTYSEHITIGRSLTLQSGSSAVIDGGGTGTAVTISAGIMGTVTITGFTIQNADKGVLATLGMGHEIHWCNIINHANWGLYNDGAIAVHAKNNWWGDASGPYHIIANPDGSGSRVWGDVDFDPWLTGSLTNAKRQTVGDGLQTVDARTEADTVVDKFGPGGAVTISVAQYTGNPGGSHTFSTIGKYIDVHIETAAIYIDVEWVRIKVYYTSAEIAGLDESSLKLYWWQPPNPGEGSWEECSNTGVTYPAGGPTYRGYIWAYINHDTTPDLAQLTGSAFGGGGAAAAAAAGIAAAVCLPKVINVTVTPTEVKPGEAVTVTAQVKNMGDAPCKYTVKLKINGVVVQTKTITLAPWETKTVTFTVVKDESGSYKVQVGDLKDEFIVSTPLSPSPASFKATSLSISPTKVGVGETVTISALVNETGGGSGNYLVILKINGVVMGKQEVTLTPQQSQTVTFTITNQQAGIHKIEVNNLAGEFTVEVVPVETSSSSAQVINWWLIGGIIAGCLIIVVVIWLTARRRY